MTFTHLHTHSAFSLYDGATAAEELPIAARDAGMEAVALTDHDSLAGAVRFFQAAIDAGIRPIIGVEFTVEALLPADLEDPDRPPHLLLLAENNEGYSNLCRLVTAARLGDARRESAFSAAYDHVDRARPLLTQENLRHHHEHLIALTGCRKRGEIPALLARGLFAQAEQVAAHYRNLFGDERLYVELHNHLLPRPYGRSRYRLAQLAARLGLPCVATNNVHYAHRSGYRLQDVMVCMGARQTVDEANPDRRPNAEYYLKTPHQMAELFADQPEAIANAARIAARCEWELDLGAFHFPAFDMSGVDTVAPAPPPGSVSEAHGQECPCHGTSSHHPLPCENEAPRAFLRRLCEDGARRLYGHLRAEVRKRLDHELAIIEAKGLADYFLIVWDIVRFARERGIRCSGRGSAGDSLVSYLLGITHADPIAHDLLFERFLNPERRNMPDIDVDFDSRRRDEVTKYIYDRYGAEHVAAVCTVNTFRARSAIREIGQALGFPREELGRLASVFPHIRAGEIADAAEKYPEVRDARLDLREKSLLIELAGEIAGLPRHLSVHVGGLLIGARPLTEMVPLELAHKGIALAQFDKDDVEALGLVKMDILGLRTHSAIEDAVDHIEAREGARPDLEALPLDDERAYELLRSTHTVGLFQLESPGQRNLLGRVQPTDFEDIIANISLFRPGPVQADMITPYIMRRHGVQQVTFVHPDLEPILRSTFGVVIYQEQVLRIAHSIAGFSLGEADLLRRMMTKDMTPEGMEELEERFVLRAGERGISPEVSQQIFEMVRGFAAYGFNKAHAACFARISYETAWLKAHYPAEFLAGILSSQPMGFYPPRTVAEDAKRCGCGILPPCVNRSEDRCLVEYGGNSVGDIRLGLWLVRGLKESNVERILCERERAGPFRSLEDFCVRTATPRPAVENLVLARAFEFTGLGVQKLTWRLGALPPDVVADRRGRRDNPSLAYDDADELARMLPSLDPMTDAGRVAADLQILGVSTTRNAFSFWRERMKRLRVTSSVKLWERKDGDRVRVAGIIVARARPPTRSGRTAIFVSLEDEMGLIDVAVFEDAYQRYGRALYTSPVICVEGRLTRLGALDLSVTAEKISGLGSWNDFGSSAPGDKTLGSAAQRSEHAARQTPARGGEGRQAASY